MKACMIVLLLVISGVALTVGIGRHSYRVDKSQLMEAMSLTFQFKPALAAFHASRGSFTRFDESSLSEPRQSEHVQSIVFMDRRDSAITVTANFRPTLWFGQFGGKAFSITTADGGKTWKCSIPRIHIGFFTPTADLLQTLSPCRAPAGPQPS